MLLGQFDKMTEPDVLVSEKIVNDVDGTIATDVNFGFELERFKSEGVGSLGDWYFVNTCHGKRMKMFDDE